MVWTRPGDSPLVLARWEGTPAREGGPPRRYRIQNVCPELAASVVDFMSDNFVDEEPMLKSLDFRNCKEALEQMRDLWTHSLEDRLGLVCLLEAEDGGKEVIVGANATTIETDEENDDMQFCPAMKSLISALVLVSTKVNIFEKYGIKEYLSAYGLSVDKNFRGQRIGLELLKARIPLCKATGLKVSGTMFTAEASRILARRVGFETVASMTFKEMKEKHNLHFGETTSDHIEYMVLEIK